jgi:CO/xanthine dehydrogenase FAD-binding subunit
LCVHDFDLLIPRSAAELERMLAETQGRILAGGTDLILFMDAGRLRPSVVIDISRLDALRYIRGDERTIRIGPLTTHTELAASPLLKEWAPILPMAAATIGAVQIRNRGTLGGNLGTASPAGDTIPALIALGASVTLRRAGGERLLPLEQFFAGPGKTALAPEEYIAEVSFATPLAGSRGAYVKAGRRKAQAITLVSVGVQVTPGSGCVGDVRLALGAVGPTVFRAEAAENALRGQRLTADICLAAALLAAGEARPISDIRASADYRRRLVQTWVRRALEMCQ